MLQSGWGYAAASASNYGAGYTGGMDDLDLGNASDSEYSDDDSGESGSEDEE